MSAAAEKGPGAADDVFQITPDGVVLPKGPKHKIPDHYVENPHRPGSYGEIVDDKFKEKLRIDPATPPGQKGPNYSHYHKDGKGKHYSPRPGGQGPGVPSMHIGIMQRFQQLNWHDSVLLNLTIDRRAPGERDEVLLLIEWIDGRKQLVRFTNCYAMEAQMNFGVIAEESILRAGCVSESPRLTEIRGRWNKLGVDLSDLLCFEIETSSTGSKIGIYAKVFVTEDA